ncbi:hypothetical protein [Bacillus sp. XF8]|uniref:Lipoprotein n=1 Tax=Bacillus bingmayongensis TaxID=1150157 RepID=A0ABU5K3Q9_9BACI|nr:hypothetical protein [Bacillus sp. XF8]MBO1582962.1 hypothetical protein [Bacillus sp. XF8]MDZ5609941.1 hypothetical protein [Bacillus pseudomycoides]
MKKVLFTLTTAAFLVTGCSSSDSSRVKELTKEIEELKKTEGGTASEEWDKQPITNVLEKAEEIVKESKMAVPDILTMKLSLTRLKWEFLNVRSERLPREYEDAILDVLLQADAFIAGYEQDTLMDKDPVIENLEKSIKKVHTTAKRFEK